MPSIKFFICGIIILGVFSIIYYIYTNSSNSQKNTSSANNGTIVRNAKGEIKYSDKLNIKRYSNPHYVVEEKTYYFSNCSNSVNAYLQLVFNSSLVNYIKNTDNFLYDIRMQISNIKDFIEIKKSKDFDFESNLSSYEIFFQNLHHFNTEKMNIKKIEYTTCSSCSKVKKNIKESNVGSFFEFKTFNEFLNEKRYFINKNKKFIYCNDETHLNTEKFTRYMVKDILIIFYNFKINNEHLLNNSLSRIKKLEMTGFLHKKDNIYKTFISENHIFHEYKGDNNKIIFDLIKLDSLLGIYEQT